MQRSLLHAGAWTMATGAAVMLSWFGVHTVLKATAYDPPRTLPVPEVPSGDASTGADPQASSTHRPRPSPTRPPAAPSAPDGPDGPDGPDRPVTPPEAGAGREQPSRSPRSPGSSSAVRGYTTDGGRVVFDLGERSASLVSATPETGWEMRAWKAEQWIRVTFTSNGRAWTVLCTWNGHPPRVRTYAG